MSEDERFEVVLGPLWLGVHYKAGQWQGEKSGAMVTALVWNDGEPAFANESTSVTIVHSNAWRMATTVNDEEKAFPFCEFSAITRTTTDKPMTQLNDGNLATCFTPQTTSEAAGTTLKTLRLSAISVSQMMKAHGDGIICSSNVDVWHGAADEKEGGGTYLSACQLTGSYVWQQKQLCLFTCTCDYTGPCRAVYLRMEYTTDISICEFQVM